MTKCDRAAEELRRVSDQIDKLRLRQDELLVQIDLPAAEEQTVRDAFSVVDEIHRFLDRAQVGPDDLRPSVVLARRLDKMSNSVAHLAYSEPKVGASAAIDRAVERLLNEMFAHTGGPRYD